LRPAPAGPIPTAQDRPTETTIRPSWPVDALATLAPLWQGPGDPVMRLGAGVVERAWRTQQGPVSVRIVVRRGDLAVQAWGPGTDVALTQLPDLLGSSDRPELLEPRHRLVSELARRHAGLRLTRSGQVMEALLVAILGQKVTGHEARRSYRELVGRLGQPAPGPLGLSLAPEPAVLARLPSWSFHAAGVEQRRADIIRRVAVLAKQMEGLGGLDPAEARRRLMAIRGVGPWTAAETLRPALGDADAVSVGDFHVPNLVCWLLAGEPRGNDERMLQLLEPYRGQRGRVVMLLEKSGRRPPRYGPRMAPRSIRRI
jgi:3-methyladenine DNA glycosylase/8-oxoguanine DNA glycosylase